MKFSSIVTGILVSAMVIASMNVYAAKTRCGKNPDGTLKWCSCVSDKVQTCSDFVKMCAGGGGKAIVWDNGAICKY